MVFVSRLSYDPEKGKKCCTIACFPDVDFPHHGYFCPAHRSCQPLCLKRGENGQLFSIIMSSDGGVGGKDVAAVLVV